jgi:nicotinate-nucleotide pyrophosphorylase (carboxylating)
MSRRRLRTANYKTKETLLTTPASLLHPDAFMSPLAIDEAVRRALDEDLGRAGDITSIATIPETTQAHAILVARQAGIIAGLPLAVATFKKLSDDILVQAKVRDGASVAENQHVLMISGPARAVLTAERTALNFVGRLSGIATLTADYVRRTAGTKLRVCCTRKTTPGLRALEKYAVRCGGGFNHRFGLDDAILIKDNHIAVAGGIRPVLERARAHVGHLVKIEIEVDTLAQLREVLDTALADVVLLDNMDTAALTEAVKMTKGRIVLEASGGVTMDSIGQIAATGVDYVSCGALTHSAANFDVAIDIDA